MKNRMTLNEVFSGWKSSEGIFTYLNVYNVPWKTELNPTYLDLDYHGNHSGNKIVSPLINSITTTGTQGVGGVLASIIWNKYGKQFKKLWDTLNFEYDPIANVDGIEEETIHNTASGSATSNGSSSGSDTQHNKENGYNTNVATPTSESTANTSANNHNESTTASQGDTTRTLRRKGNIGVTMSQQLINAERDVWLWNYFEQVYSMIDEVLTLKVW